jgi:hypothetical protein
MRPLPELSQGGDQTVATPAKAAVTSSALTLFRVSRPYGSIMRLLGSRGTAVRHDDVETGVGEVARGTLDRDVGRHAQDGDTLDGASLELIDKVGVLGACHPRVVYDHILWLGRQLGNDRRARRAVHQGPSLTDEFEERGVGDQFRVTFAEANARVEDRDAVRAGAGEDTGGTLDDAGALDHLLVELAEGSFAPDDVPLPVYGEHGGVVRVR